jgi:hypothetical protein
LPVFWYSYFPALNRIYHQVLAKKYPINNVLSLHHEEGRVLSLYPEGELFIPIKQLKIRKNVSCKLNDVLKMVELINDGKITEPIIINNDNLIVDGFKRYFAYKRMGCNKVIVIKSTSHSFDDDENEFRIIKNQSE